MGKPSLRSSDVQRGAAHYAAAEGHEPGGDRRHRRTARLLRHRPVPSLVPGHLLQNPAALRVGFGELAEVVVEVSFDLAFRFGDEAEAHIVSDRAGDQADHGAARVPERVEDAAAAAEFLEPVSTPRQVVALLPGGLPQVPSGLRRTREYGLSVVECLCGDFSGVVDAKQRDARLAVPRVERRLVDGVGR